MAGYTYTTLKQAIQDYTDNQETTFVANIDNFIRNTEEKILGEGQLEVFRKSASAALTSGNKFFQKPSDWLFTYSLNITDAGGDKKFLLNKDTNFLAEYWPDDSVTGEPKYYSDFNLANFAVAPTPSAAFAVEVNYFYRPTSLVDDPSGATWLSENASTCMLYGCLTEAYIFMKNEPDMIANYDKMFMQAMQQLGRFANSAEGLDFYRRASA